MALDSHDVHVPNGLTAKGRKVAQAIVRLLKKKEATYTGGCRTFYTPQEWRDRGEDYGTGPDALLIVVYDGGEVGQFFDFDACAPDYSTMEDMRLELEKLDVYSECCTCWYSVVVAQ